uniref:Intersectin 2b n=1 Tax=Amphiprion percula TaxID=161767 RepID=A0A3P8S4D3_AMPPE
MNRTFSPSGVPEERNKHDQKFDTLSPSMGYVSGEQARKFFLQSGLPSNVLADIWALADMNKDGKMDRLEFSIAMKLIKLKLQGTPLPSALPVIMKQPPVPAPSLNNPTSTMTSSAYASTPTRPLIPTMGNATLPNGTMGMLHPIPAGALTTGLPLSATSYSSPLGLSSPAGINKSSSLLDLGSGSCITLFDWAVPHASRLKYRQQFNSLDKQMTGYLTGQQVRGAMATTMLTQTQLASIWTLADVDKDGKLKAEEFILAMHLVDMAKSGQPLPLTLPTELVPPSQRYVNFTHPLNLAVSKLFPPLCSVSFEDKFKANLEQGNAELEKRRLALQEAERREQERRAQKEREERERREKEAREAEERRRKEEERRLERQRELERQKEEERQREIERKEAAQRELERQRKEEWERRRRGELQIKKEQEQDEIIKLKAKKRSLEMELEAVGNKHRQISDRLRDIQNNKKLQKTEIDLNNQRKETRQQDINNLQKQLEEFQRKLSHLTPEQKRLTEKLRNMGLNNLPVSTMSTLKVGVTEKNVKCMKLRDQLEALEKETAAKLAEMDQYNNNMQELRESQRQQQAALEKLRSIKEDKRRELIRRKEQEEERRREEERKRQEEERRLIKMEKERQWQEKLKRDEEERQRRLQEEREAKQREEEEKERQAIIRAAKEQAERELRVKEEAERKKRMEEDRKKREEDERRRQAERRRQEEERRKLEEERRQLEEERRKLEEERRQGEKRRKEEEEQRKREEERKRLEEERREEERRREKEEEERRRQRPRARQHRKSAALTSFKALYPFTARNNEELSFNAEDIIEVDETTEREEGWLYGSRQGKMGWFPESYVERVDRSDAANNTQHDQTRGYITVYLCLCMFAEYVALYTYESPERGDLTFSEGDVILVSKREGEWWNGSIGDRTGVFPSNYVKPKEADTSSISGKKKPEIAQVIKAHTSTGSEQLNLENGQLIVILGKTASGWWLGELQARGKKRQKGWFPASNVKILGSNSGKSTPAHQPVCQVIAIYDYTAANQDEMSFTKGQLINVLDKNDPDWWKGEINGIPGLFPTNYVKMTTVDCDPSQQWCADLNSLDSLSPQEKKRQGYIHELLQTEERYVDDLQIVLEVFHKPMSESGRLNDAEMSMIFVNWKELLACNTKLVKAFRVRKKTGGENMPVQMIGDILAAELSHMQPYIRFCSCQINGATLLQTRTDSEPDFKDFLKKIATDYRCKGMPLSSFLLKPMQRITRYPLHIKNILECTAEGHADRGPLKEALERAEELCQQVNEGVREKENSDRLEWIQNHVQCDGAAEHLVFNSLTNCLGPRKLLHSGKMFKAKSNKELWAFLFNDFLLLTHAAKQFTSSGLDKLFSNRNNVQLKMYKPPVLLNEVLVKLPDPSSDEPTFHISHIDRVYILRTDNINERTAWVQKIKAASEEFIETEKKKREKAYQARSVKTSGIGRLLVTILEATELKAAKPNGKSNPYCEVTMGAQIFTSRTLNDTLNPKWNFNCQFHIKDLYQDVLCITIFERDQFSPDDFLGRTEVPMATIKKEVENKGLVTRRLLLREVPTGEVWVRLDLQLFGNK